MQADTISDLVRRFFGAFRSGDRQFVESVLSDDFTFTSPYDDHIDRATYFERCWPHRGLIRAHHFEEIVPHGDAAFVLYECETASGAKFRNTEHLVFERGKVKAVEVFFGGLPSDTNETGSPPNPPPS